MLPTSDSSRAGPNAPHAARALIIPGAPGRDLHAFGNQMQLLLTASDAAGALVARVETTPAGGSRTPSGRGTDGRLYVVLGGTEEFLVDGRWTVVAPTGVAHLPRGLPHAWRNPGDAPSRHVVLTAPLRLDPFLRECAAAIAAAATGAARTLADVARAAHAHGVEFLVPFDVPRDR